MTERIIATYHVRSDATAITARAQAIAVEQSVEMPLSAIEFPPVLTEIVGRVEDIFDRGGGVFAVRIGIAAATVGGDAGQLLNMLFGNSSLHDDIVLADMILPAATQAAFPGARHRLASLTGRALTCSALKPQGMPPAALADLCARLARGKLDFIKDDHGLADQAFSPFAARVSACAAALRAVAAEQGSAARYVPSLSGDLDMMREQAKLARDEGIDCLLLAPMISGVATMTRLVREFPAMAFFAHPALAGAARIAPELLMGKIFPLFGADAVVFPTFGGRFGYSPATCHALAENARANGAIPVPAGGITLPRVPEILDFYGPDTMLLLGGSLLDAKARLIEETTRFTRAVAAHAFR